MLNYLNTCRRIWLVIQVLQKHATAATHALPKCLMSKNIYTLKDGVGPLVSVLTLPCFCHKNMVCPTRHVQFPYTPC
jgi:hypothetical protein